MPFINIKMIEDGTTDEQKSEIVRRITETMVEVLGKDPATTHIVIDEVPLGNWGYCGQTVKERRKAK